MTSTVYLILLLPAVWLLVMLVRYLMGSGFKSKDTLAKDDGLAMSRWQQQQNLGQKTLEERQQSLKEQDEMDKHAVRNEQVYATHDSKLDHIKKEFHVGEEKETIYPERNKPKK